jgi:hypothetical protein
MGRGQASEASSVHTENFIQLFQPNVTCPVAGEITIRQPQVVPGGPHGLTWTHADAVNRALLEFLAQEIPRARPLEQGSSCVPAPAFAPYRQNYIAGRPGRQTEIPVYYHCKGSWNSAFIAFTKPLVLFLGGILSALASPLLS